MSVVGSETKTLFDGFLTVSNIIVMVTVCCTIIGCSIGVIVFIRNMMKERREEDERRRKHDDERDDKIMKAINDRDAILHERLDDHKALIDSFWKRGEISEEFQHQRKHVDTVDESLLRRIEAGAREHVALSLEVARLHERMNMRDEADKETKNLLRDMNSKITDITIKLGVR